MKKDLKLILIFGIFCFWGIAKATPYDSFLPKDNLKLEKELNDLVLELRKIRMQHYEKERQWEKKLKKNSETITKLEKRIVNLNQQHKELDTQISKTNSIISEQKAELQTRSEQLGKISQNLTEFAKLQQKAVYDGIPFKVDDRVKKLENIKGQDNKESESARFFLDYLIGELSMADSGQVFTKEIPLDKGRAKSSWCIRVGHLFLAFTTKDGTEAGVWRGRSGGENRWNKDLTEQQVKNINKGIKILKNQEIPARLSLPIPIKFKKSNYQGYVMWGNNESED